MNSSSHIGYVFVSYARQDIAVQKRILASLRERGISVWVDTENLEPGTRNWEGAIENGIKGCGAVVVLLSPSASKSEWVLREVIYADVHQKRILPVLIEGDDRSSVPFHLISYQRIHLTKDKDWNLGLEQLADTLRGYSQIERERMRIQAELAAQKEVARQAAIKTIQEKAAQEAAERVAREKSERSREERNRNETIRAAQEEARRLAAEKVAREEYKQRAEEAARRKATEDFARKDWITSDDKLWATLAYVFSPLIAIILLFIEDKKNRPFIKFHAIQSIAAFVVISILSVITLGFGSIFYLITLWWAYQAYQGQDVKIPVISDFIRNQGWA